MPEEFTVNRKNSFIVGKDICYTTDDTVVIAGNLFYPFPNKLLVKRRHIDTLGIEIYFHS